MKYLLLGIVLSVYIWGAVITPKLSITTSSPVLDFVLEGKNIWAGTANGEVLHINTKGKILSKILLPPIVDSWGEKGAQKILSIDVAPDGKTLVLAGEDGWLYLVKEGKPVKTSFSTKTVVKKIGFITQTRVIISLLSNEVVFFDLQTDKVIKTLSGGTSPLSDMALSTDKKIAIIAGEAGVVSVIDTGIMKIIRRIQGGNVDNIYKLDLQNAHIITAGQDRRAILYTLDGKSYTRFEGTFLIYAAALSPKAERMAASMDEENLITVYDTIKRQKIATAKGHSATLNRILFVDEKRFVSCADENKILFWELP
jgi:WD40 repeat protein